MATDVLARPATGPKEAPPPGTIEVEAGALKRAMRQLAELVERRSTLPVLSCVMLVAKRDRLLLTATDLDIWASDQVAPSCHASEVVPFKLCVPARRLYEAVQLLPAAASVRLTEEKGRLRVTSEGVFGPVSYRFPTYPVADFPALPKFEPQAEFEMRADELAAGIDAVRHAISTEEARYYLNGIFWHVLDGSLVFAATDGHRLARWRTAVPDGAETLPAAILNHKTIKTIAALIDHLPQAEADETDVAIAINAARVSVTIGTTELVCKLIDGTFPDYTRVVPANFAAGGWDKVATLRPGHLAGAVRQVMLVSGEKTRAVKLGFTAGRLELAVNSPDNGDASASMTIGYTGAPLEIGFNARYLLDILNRFGGEECQMVLADGAAPTLIRNYEGAPCDYTLMPMRV